MSLNFDLTACKKNLGERYDVITTSPATLGSDKQLWHPITDALIWATMSVGLGKIEEDNIDEWCFRLGLLAATGGAAVSAEFGDGSRFVGNRNDLVNHIGLKTNVPTEKRNVWLARMFGKGSYDAQRVALKPTEEPSATERINARYAELKQKELQAANN